MTKTVNESNSKLREINFSVLYVHTQQGQRRVRARIQQPFTYCPLDTSLLGPHTDWEVSLHQQTLE